MLAAEEGNKIHGGAGQTREEKSARAKVKISPSVQGKLGEGLVIRRRETEVKRAFRREVCSSGCKRSGDGMGKLGVR